MRVNTESYNLRRGFKVTAPGEVNDPWDERFVCCYYRQVVVLGTDITNLGMELVNPNYSTLKNGSFMVNITLFRYDFHNTRNKYVQLNYFNKKITIFLEAYYGLRIIFLY